LPSGSSWGIPVGEVTMTKGLEYSLQGLIKCVDVGVVFIAIATAILIFAKAVYWFEIALDIEHNGR